MDILTVAYDTIDSWAVALLSSHLPSSLPLLRYMQFALLRPTQGPLFFVLSGSPHLHNATGSTSVALFSAALVNYGAGRETQMWMYSTIEDAVSQSSPEVDMLLSPPTENAPFERETAIKVIKEVQTLTGRVLVQTPEILSNNPWDGLLLGSLSNVVRDIIMESPGVHIEPRASGFYDKWLFSRDVVPQLGSLPNGMTWAEPTLQDCQLVISRTNIPRQATTLLSWPSLFVKLPNGTPIAWAFLGADGSLSSLHCEEPYRGQGIAKCLASKLIRDKTLFFGSDGWASADVSPDNTASRAVCRSIGGNPAWVNSWVVLRV